MEKWIQYFEKRAKARFSVEEGEVVRGDVEKGFLGYKLDARTMEVIITKMAGDGKFWYNRIIDMMEAMKNDGWYHCMFSTNRNPDAFKRFVGGNLVMSREENGQMIHYFDWTLETGHGRYGNG